MKAILAIICIVLLGLLLGWFTFNRSENQTTITIKTEKIRQDGRQAIEEGKKVLGDKGQTEDKAADPGIDNRP